MTTYLCSTSVLCALLALLLSGTSCRREDKDQIETALMDTSLLMVMQSPFGCRAMTDVLRFYLETVLPAAEIDSKDFKIPISTIGNIFYELKRELVYCKDYLSCKKPFEIESIIDTYNKMEDKGLYKAMGELELLFNYIEEYMVSMKQ
ncbi:hypothetical protein JZ751_023363 [Albula glossodonta]|uniref:Interleukin family protein n=1 Tax=Albula glossodonta TaxID=121402 RepID=A0A8T2NJ35_9TELE|nr:hypothetical protein JZ751_023363 [Albula glossodonta]